MKTLLRLLMGHLSLWAALLAGPGWAAEMDYPLAIAVSPAGDIFLADRNLPGVWKIQQGEPSLYFKASKQFRTPLNAIRCLAFDGQGRLLAGDSATRQVYRFDEADEPVPLLENAVGIGIPMSLAVNRAGELLVADLELHRVWKVPQEGGEPKPFAEVTAPRGLAIDDQDHLWVVSHGRDHVLRITPDGETVETVVEGRPFQFPHNLVLDDQGTAYITDGYAKAVWKMPAGEQPQKWVEGQPLINPVGLARKEDRLLVVDPHAKAVFQIDPQGELSKVTK